MEAIATYDPWHNHQNWYHLRSHHMCNGIGCNFSWFWCSQQPWGCPWHWHGLRTPWSGTGKGCLDLPAPPRDWTQEEFRLPSCRHWLLRTRHSRRSESHSSVANLRERNVGKEGGEKDRERERGGEAGDPEREGGIPHYIIIAKLYLPRTPILVCFGP